MFSDLISYPKSCYIKSWIIRCSLLTCCFRPYAVMWLRTRKSLWAVTSGLTNKKTSLCFICFDLLRFESGLKDVQEEDCCQTYTNRCVNWIWAGLSPSTTSLTVWLKCVLALGNHWRGSYLAGAPPLPPFSILPGDSVTIHLQRGALLRGSCSKCVRFIYFIYIYYLLLAGSGS